MRIVGEIDHPFLKISLFHHDGKFTAQIEDGPIMQTYKFREDVQLNTPEEFKKIMNGFIQNFEMTNKHMHKVFQDMASTIAKEDEFPEII